MINLFLEKKLIYRRGKSIYINQTNSISFLQNPDVDFNLKLKFLETVREIEDYNAINAFLKNFENFPEDIQKEIINLIDGIPFSKIKDNIQKLLNHRDINVRINTLKALKHYMNFSLAEMIFPLTKSQNPTLKILALNAYYKIVYNYTINEYSLMIASENEDIKKLAYHNLLDIVESNKEIEDLKNIEYFDESLKNTAYESLNEEKSEIDLYEINEKLEELQKNGNINTVSFLSLSALLIISLIFNFYTLKEFEKYKNMPITTTKPTKIINPIDVKLKNDEHNTLEKAIAYYEKGLFDSSEVLFNFLNENKIKNFYLFNINMKKGNYNKAAFYFLNMPEYSADNLNDYVKLIKGLINEKRYELALECVKKIDFLNSSEIKKLTLEIYKNIDIKEALKYNEINNLNDKTVYTESARLFESEKNYEKAIYCYKKLYKLTHSADDRKIILKKIVSLYEKTKNFNALKKFLNEIKEDNEKLYLILYKNLELKNENYANALEYIDKLLKLATSEEKKSLLKQKITILSFIDKEQARVLFKKYEKELNIKENFENFVKNYSKNLRDRNLYNI
jgi:hypothetical protein